MGGRTPWYCNKMTSEGAEQTDLKGMTLPELEEFLSRWGKERYRARQLFRWIYQKHVDDFAAMTDLSKELRGILVASCRISGFSAERVETSADGTEKYLFRLEDGEAVESVLIPDEGRRTLCISSQAGCALRCAFCATGRLGLARSLAAWEMVAQLLHLRADSTRPITGVVFMGQGEPFANYDAVIDAARGMGMTGGQIVRKVEVPLALPVR